MNDYERVARVIRHMDESFFRQPGLDELADFAGLSPAHFHRLFVNWAGITPKDFIQSLTLDHARNLLGCGTSVLDTALQSGLSGPGRLHDLCVSLKAATPGEIKNGGADMKITYGVADSPFGKVFLAQSPRGLCHLSFFDLDPAPCLAVLENDWPAAKLCCDHDFALLQAREIFPSSATISRTPRKLALHVKGSPFQLKVWDALLRIPEGKLTTYGRLARDIEQQSAARAVGNAVGKNQISYLIPCHRVIRETGVLGGYRWGPFRKRVLLSWEKAKTSIQP
ncbi:MAG: methylated-DNA--[protein]-cysteine S-methyltransferase [Armatimonadetes bacterium]|nr:methylated-DNA--[protein]-cysteine S-methyltransferase [Akkermansiaceae bacterium]